MNYPQALLVPLKSMCYSIIVMGPQSHAPSLLRDTSRGGLRGLATLPFGSASGASELNRD